MNTLADWGLAGTTIVAEAIGALLLGAARSWRYVRRSETEFRSSLSNKFAFVLGASLGLVALLVHSVVDFNMHIPANAMLAVCLMALLASHLRFTTDRYWVTARWLGRVLAGAVLLSGVAYLGYQEVRLGREYVWVERAAKAEPYSAAQWGRLEQAHQISPAQRCAPARRASRRAFSAIARA